jgi:hypothetical protein
VKLNYCGQDAFLRIILLCSRKKSAMNRHGLSPIELFVLSLQGGTYASITSARISMFFSITERGENKSCV